MPTQTKIVNKKVRKITYKDGMLKQEGMRDTAMYYSTVHDPRLFKSEGQIKLDGKDIIVQAYNSSGTGNTSILKFLDLNRNELQYRHSLDILAKQLGQETSYTKGAWEGKPISKTTLSTKLNIILRKNGVLSYGKGGYDPTKDGYFYKQRVKYNGQEFVGFGISNVPGSRIKQYQKEREEYDYDAYFTKMWKGRGKDIASFEKELKHLIKQQNKITVDLPGFKTESMKWMHESLIEEYASKYNLELANPDDYGAVYGEGDRSNL